MGTLIKVGDVLYGFCNGAFGRDDYDTKICVKSNQYYSIFVYKRDPQRAVVLNYKDYPWITENDINNWKDKKNETN